jgi:prephenate dehydrogenase
MTVQVTILGLGQIGASIGLALGEHKDLVRRIGNDTEPKIARRAEKMGAIDHVIFNLPSAVRQADLVILALPVDEIREVLEVISQDLKEGSVIIDTSHTKEAVAKWAAELLPPDRHFVAWTPTINPAYLHETVYGIDAAHADLFRDCLIFITTPPGAAAPAIKLASDLTSLIGGKPFFADQAEVDGLLAASTLLPELTAAALVNAVMDQPGWDEGRKLAGRPFALATSPILGLEGNKTIAQAALANRENVVRVIDNLIASLTKLRQAIQNDDAAGLQKQVQAALEDREIWIGQRKINNWASVDSPPSALPTAGDVLGRLVGLRPKPTPKDRNK